MIEMSLVCLAQLGQIGSPCDSLNQSHFSHSLMQMFVILSKLADKNKLYTSKMVSAISKLYLHVPTICLDIWVGPDKDVVDGEEDGKEGDGKDVDGHCEESSDFLLMI